MFVAVVRDSFTDDQAGVADRFGDGQDAEIALSKIAERVEIEHLPIGVKESMVGVIAGRGGTDNHAGCIHALTGDAIGRAGGSTECSQIGNAEGGVGVSARASDEEEQHRGEAGFVYRFINSRSPSESTCLHHPSSFFGCTFRVCRCQSSSKKAGRASK